MLKKEKLPKEVVIKVDNVPIRVFIKVRPDGILTTP
jgi:hypothetical protein